MATVQESIEVDVPLSQAYNQWTQFEDFPHFMSGVDSVTPTRRHHRPFQDQHRRREARIRRPDHRPGTGPAGVLGEPGRAAQRRHRLVRDRLGAGGTKVNVELTWEPDSAAEKIGAAIGLDSRQVAVGPEEIQEVHRGARRRDRRLARNGSEGGGRVDRRPAGAGAAGGAVSSDATTAVPLEEEVDYGAEPAFQHVDADPDLAPEPPFGRRPARADRTAWSAR